MWEKGMGTFGTKRVMILTYRDKHWEAVRVCFNDANGREGRYKVVYSWDVCG